LCDLHRKQSLAFSPSVVQYEFVRGSPAVSTGYLPRTLRLPKREARVFGGNAAMTGTALHRSRTSI